MQLQLKFLASIAFAFTTGQVIADAQVYGFITAPPDYKTVEQIVVPNMPPVRSQGVRGICYAFSAAVILEHYNCKEEKLNCSALSDDDRPAVLDLKRYATDDAASFSSTPRKDYFGQNSFGGDILQNVSNSGITIKESCAPYKVKSNVLVSGDIVVKSFYTRYKGRTDEETNEAIQNLIRDVGLNASLTEIKLALQMPSVEEFGYAIDVPEVCLKKASKRLTFLSIQIGKWPLNDTSERDKNYVYALSLIKKNFEKGRPVMIDRLCLLKNNTQRCREGEDSGGHSLVVSGHRRVCSHTGKCIDQLKVHNSWGPKWQELNDDGWVEARELIQRTLFQYGSFASIRNRYDDRGPEVLNVPVLEVADLNKQ